MKKTCFQIPALLSPEECQHFIESGEKNTYSPTGRDYPANYRNNDRIVLDRPELAELLWERLRQHLPSKLQKLGKSWTLDSLNPRFRGCRYRGGQSFRRHRDGAFSPDAHHRSFLTVMLYLNAGREFQGGGTRFYTDRYCSEFDFEVSPEVGTAIVFEHDYWHDGQAVSKGTKYVLRTDVVYRSAQALNGHRGYVWDVKALSCGSLITGGRDQTVRVWRGSSECQVLQGHQASVTCLAEVPGGFVSGSRDRQILRWLRTSPGRFEQIQSLSAHQGALLALCPTPEGGLLSSSADGTVKSWTLEGLLSRSCELGSWPWALAPIQDGHLVVTEKGELLRLSPCLSKIEILYEHSVPLRALCVLPASQVLLGDFQGKLLHLSPEFHMLHKVQAHRGPVTCLLPLKGGGFVSGGEDDGVKVWRDREVQELHRHSDFVRALCLTPEGRVVSASYDGSLQFSKPSAMLRTVSAAKPGGTSSGTVAAS